MWYWPCPKFPAFNCADLHVVENAHPVHRNFCRLLFAYGLWNALFVSLENTFEFSAHPQHDIGIETAQPRAPRAPRLQQTGDWLELISHGRTLCSKVSFSRTRSRAARVAYSSSAALVSRQTRYVPSSSIPSMKSPKRKRISYVKSGVLIVDQIKPAIFKGTAVRFDLSKGKGIK